MSVSQFFNQYICVEYIESVISSDLALNPFEPIFQNKIILQLKRHRNSWLILIRMDIFHLLRKHFTMGGIEISQKLSKNHPFNVKNMTFFILFCISICLTVLSLTEADTFDECTDILFRSVSAGVCGIIYEIIVWKTSKLYGFVNNLADAVNESEFRFFIFNMYENTAIYSWCCPFCASL